MPHEKSPYIGVDIFAGAGGLSLGAKLAGIDVCLAIEKDIHAAHTYMHNHPETKVIVGDIREISDLRIARKNKCTILFGGPPCQGFSISNQRTRNIHNPSNWLFQEFVRIITLVKPDWVVFENVQGIVETEGGMFRDNVIRSLQQLGYTCSYSVLCASDYSVPQKRSRFFLLASRYGKTVDFTLKKATSPVSVYEAISDLPSLQNGASCDYLDYSKDATCSYAKKMRVDNRGCTGHLVTKNSRQVIQRYSYIPQGGNWENIPENLMANYTDRSRCHTGVYHRLNEKKPAITIGNYRKAMLIHPWEDRGLSVREAARLQSFPDSYSFTGSIGFQQQQVGNAVPPILAKAVFELLIESDVGSK